MQDYPDEHVPVEYETVIEDESPKKNWLPLILMGVGFSLTIVCGLMVVIGGVLVFRSSTPSASTEPTATTLNVISFVTAEPGVELDSQATDAPELPQETPTAANTQGEGTDDATPSDDDAAPFDPYSMTSPDYSIHAFLFWRSEVADRDLGLIEDMGFRWVKQEFAWREIEGAGKGVFNWENTDRMMTQIEDHKLKIIARIGVQPEWAGGGYPEVGPPENYQDFGDFVFEVASRYKGKIGAYQIWNEPNLSREWGERPPSPEEYTELLKIAYEAVKKADPNAIVITAGLAPTTRNDHVAMPDIYFVQGLYDAGAAPYFDMLGVHGAGYKAPPEMDPGEVARDPNFSNPGDHEAGTPEELRRIYCFRHVEDVREIMVKNNDADKRVAVLEFGWTTDHRKDSPYRWHRVEEDQQADYLVGAYQYAKENWQPWIGIMSVIFMPDANWTKQDEQYYWSILIPNFPDTWPRPAYYKLKDMPK